MGGEEKEINYDLSIQGNERRWRWQAKLVVIVVVWYFQDCEQGRTSWAGMREAGKESRRPLTLGRKCSLSHQMSCYKFWLFSSLNCQLHLDVVAFLVFLSSCSISSFSFPVSDILSYTRFPGNESNRHPKRVNLSGVSFPILFSSAHPFYWNGF